MCRYPHTEILHHVGFLEGWGEEVIGRDSSTGRTTLTLSLPLGITEVWYPSIPGVGAEDLGIDAKVGNPALTLAGMVPLDAS